MLIEQGATFDLQLGFFANRLPHLELLVARRETLLLPPVLTKLLLVAVNANPLHGRRNAEDRFAFRRRGFRRPMSALVDPGAQQADLFRRQRLTLARGRHLHVLHQPRDVVDQFAFRAVAGNDVVLVVLAPFERRLAIVEPEMRLGFFRSVATETTLLEEGFHVAVELHLRRRGCGQLADIRFGSCQGQAAD